MAGGSVFSSYTKKTGFAYIFNLVVGVGALALPKQFAATGVILASTALLWLASLAFLTITFMVESMATANAVVLTSSEAAAIVASEKSEREPLRSPGDPPHENIPPSRSPDMPLGGTPAPQNAEAGAYDTTNPFAILQKFEMSQMAVLFLGHRGKIAFYAVLVIYLFGDLAIYAVSVPLSLVRVTGPFAGWTSLATYRIYLLIFALLMIPFSFFDMNSSKYLQIATLALRNFCFFLMVVLGLVFIGEGNGASESEVPFFTIGGLPRILGVALYAFMCHHSLPSIVQPIRNKSRMFRMFFGDFVVIYIAYFLLCWSAVFAFYGQSSDTCPNHPGEACQLQPLYTLNFSSYKIQAIASFLALFPCFTLTSNFPMICITLRNNIAELAFPGDTKRQAKWKPVLALSASVPPMIIACFTQQVDFLVSITGSFAGVGIQYVLPALFVYFGRKKAEALGLRPLRSLHCSPAKSTWFIWGVLAWSAIALVLAVYNIVESFRSGSV